MTMQHRIGGYSGGNVFKNGHRIRPRRKKIPGEMNKTEQQYADEVLEPLKREGKIWDYKYEALHLKLAPSTFIVPDFFVTYPDHMEVHEVKGHWEDDARAKIKIAAAMFPEFDFIAVTLAKLPEQAKIRNAPKYWMAEAFPSC
jgi:hypothetical protein